MSNPTSEPQMESPSRAEADEAEAPTYAQDTWSGLDHFVCLAEGWQCWSEADMQQHMTTYHEGAMRAAPGGSGPEGAASPSVDAAEESAGQEAETAETDPATLSEAPAPAAER